MKDSNYNSTNDDNATPTIKRVSIRYTSHEEETASPNIILKERKKLTEVL